MTMRLTINRAPVLTLWASVVAERLGYDRAGALTLGKAVAGLNAQSKGRRLGIFAAPKEADAKAKAAERKKSSASAAGRNVVELLHRQVPVTRTSGGVRALEHGKPANPEVVERYLQSKFGDALDDARSAMRALARAYPRKELAERAYALYEAFRPAIPAGTRGWGAAGVLNLERVRGLASKTRRAAPRTSASRAAVSSRKSRPAPRARRPS